MNMKNLRFKSCILALFMAFSVMATYAQQSVTGTVRDASGPLPGVSVVVQGTSRGVQTNENGQFTIQASPTEVLVFSIIGYTSQTATVGTSQTLNIILVEDASALEEVVVTALGIRRERKSLGYAVQEIGGAQLVESREANLANALVGKSAGLQVAKSSNGAGSSAKIILRGFNSLTGDNQPLIVVDGIPMNNFTGTTENGYFGAGLDMGNGLGDISADDIESMSVLKGASAAALYGNRAGNGVILITTKSGRKNEGLGITVSSNVGIESIFTRPATQDIFGQGSDGVFNEMSTLSWGPAAVGQPITKWDGTPGTLTTHDNVSNFLRNATSQNHNLAFQQQYGNTSIYTSFNQMDNRSIIPENKFVRTNLTARATTKFGKEDRWTTDTKVQYNNTAGYNRPINGRDWSSIYTLQMLPRSLDIRDFSAGTNEFGQMIWYDGSNAVNPYWNALNNLNSDKRDRFIFNGSVKYEFNDWLSGEIKSGADIYTTTLDARVYAGGPNPPNGRFSTSKETFMETNHTALFIAQKDNVFGKLGGTITLGGNLMSSKWENLGISVGELEVPNLFYVGNSVGTPGFSQGLSERKINSAFGSLALNYDGYLYLEGTFRNDWTSTLHPDNRSFFYPAVNLSYVVSDMINKTGGSLPSWLSYAKLRASYAEVGNDMAPYQLYNVYSIGNDPLGNVTANTGSVFYDPTVRSELIQNLEFGGELRFLNNRVGLDVSWYKSNATYQLIDLPLDPSSGFGDRKINAGDIQNKGWEIVANVDILGGESKFGWNATVNFSRNINTIVDIAEGLGVNQYRLPGGGFDDLAIIARSGGYYGEIWGHRYLRVSDEASPYYGQLLLSGTGMPQRDPVQTKLGDQQAREMVSLINSFNYKNFGLSFQIDGRFGGQMFAGTHLAMQRFGTAAVTAVRDGITVAGVVSDGAGGYTPNTTAITTQQYYNAITTANNLGINEEFLYDATNVRLRNVQLSYNLPRSVLGNSVVQNARIFASCNNVWMIHSKMDGLDPESTFATGTNAIGFENGAPPTMRSFIFGLTIGF